PLLRPPPPPPLFPYTTLFRSADARVTHGPANISAQRAADACPHSEPRGTVHQRAFPGAHRRAQRSALSGPHRHTLAEANDCAFRDRKSTRLNSSHLGISYAVF